MSSTSGKWWATIASCIVLGSLALYLRQANLAEGTSWLPQCMFNELTGWHCPGCGNTRASHALLHGDINGAFQQNALFLISLPFLGWGMLRMWWDWMYPGKWKLHLPFRWKWAYSLVLIGILVAFFILRNVPAFPFNWLAPVPLES